jgi:glutamate-1-semialdehyde 2,1-aminomutase
VAAVIVEPVAANMGVVPPRPGYLAALRELTRAAGALLIFDEVITGFRVGYGGAQEKYGVLPDLTVLGKIIGGGFPVGAYGGREDIMAQMAPVGPVYQAGTLSGNPVGVAAGIETLRALADPAIYDRLEAMTQILQDDLGRAAATVGAEVTINRVGSMLTVFFTRGPVTDWRSASAADTAAYGRFFRAMLEQGVYLPPSQFEAWFVSAAHAGDELRRIATASQVGLARGILVD